MDKARAQSRISSFTQLRTWQKSKKFVGSIYNLSNTFTREELFGLTSQIRRSAVSVPSNIAEGFSRASAKDKGHFYIMGLGSLTETISHLYIAEELGYIKREDIVVLENEATDISKMINGMIKTAKGRNT